MFDLARFPDRKHLKRRNGRNNAGWQFATKKRGFEETKFFGDSTYGDADRSYEAAIAHRNQFLAAARELGIADENGIIVDRLPINLNLGARNNSGIVGVNRQTRSLRRNRKTPEEYWVANYKDEKDENQQIEFGIHSQGEKAALLQAVEYRRGYVQQVRDTLDDDYYREQIDAHLQELDDILECVRALSDPGDLFEFLATLNNPILSSTEKQALLAIRIAQRRFRRLVLDYWRHKCVVTGASVLLTAGHIKPWAVATDAERIDVFNGLALSPVYDKAFDVGLISFDRLGNILISGQLLSNTEALSICRTATLPSLDDRHLPYLAWHRENVYRDG